MYKTIKTSFIKSHKIDKFGGAKVGISVGFCITAENPKLFLYYSISSSYFQWPQPPSKA